MFAAHIQQRGLHLQRADPGRWVQRLHLRQTRSPAEFRKPSAEAARLGPQRSSSGPVPSQGQYPAADLAHGSPCARAAECSANRRDCGCDGFFWKALSDHPQSQLSQEMRQQFWDNCCRLSWSVRALLPTCHKTRDWLEVMPASSWEGCHQGQSSQTRLKRTEQKCSIQQRGDQRLESAALHETVHVCFTATGCLLLLPTFQKSTHTVGSVFQAQRGWSLHQQYLHHRRGRYERMARWDAKDPTWMTNQNADIKGTIVFDGCQ